MPQNFRMEKFCELPLELKLNVFKFTSNQALLNLRCTSKQLAVLVHDDVLNRFFTHRRHLDVPQSLDVLCSIAETPHLRNRLQSVTISAVQTSIQEIVQRREPSKGDQVCTEQPSAESDPNTGAEYVISAPLSHHRRHHAAFIRLSKAFSLLWNDGIMPELSFRNWYPEPRYMNGLSATTGPPPYGSALIKRVLLREGEPGGFLYHTTTEAADLAFAVILETKIQPTVLEFGRGATSFTYDTLRKLSNAADWHHVWCNLRKLCITIDFSAGDQPNSSSRRRNFFSDWLSKLTNLEELDLNLPFRAVLTEQDLVDLSNWLRKTQLTTLKLTYGTYDAEGLHMLLLSQRHSLRALSLDLCEFGESGDWLITIAAIARDLLHLQQIRFKGLWQNEKQVLFGRAANGEDGAYEFSGQREVEEGLKSLVK